MKQLFLSRFVFLFGLWLFSQPLLAQFTASGTVTDVNSEPLPGVSVQVKGTTSGTITGIDGSFSLNVPSDAATLDFSFIGFSSQEVTIASSSNAPINITLQESTTTLDAVVVTGLASSVKRSNSANAVSAVSGEELAGSTSIQTLDGGLQGKLTGANIISNSGAPGGGFSFKLRGITTVFGSSEPLYIIDGIYMDNSSFSAGTNPVSLSRTNGEVTDEQDNPSNRIADLNPEDIESVEVLKGASAAAIYGARANAGVVIITTKRGQAGKTRISFNQSVGQAELVRKLGLRDYTADRIRNTFLSPFSEADVQAFESGPLYDYEEELYGNKGTLYNGAFTVSGGNQNTKFYINASYKDEEGIIKRTGFERRSIRTNVDHKISEIFDLKITANYINSSADRGISNNDNSGVSLGIALGNTPPWQNLFPDENGIYPNNNYNSSNPLQTRDLMTNNETTNRLLGGATLNVNILRKPKSFLKLALNAGLDYFTNETTVHFPENLQFMVGNLNGFYSLGNNVVLNNNLSAVLVYENYVSDWTLRSQAGLSRLDFSQKRVTTQATNLVGGQTNLEQAGSISVFNRELESEDIGYFLQQEANWDDKVILTAGVRVDQSTLNGDPDELFYYPKASAAVNLANFDFLAGGNTLSLLKLRAAYGEAGGVPTASPNDLALPSQSVLIGSNIEGNTGSLIGSLRGNPDIRPERSKEFETGIDIGLFDNRVALEATFYNKMVDDLILQAEVAESQGFEFEILNGGKLRNRGFELALSLNPVATNNVNWVSRVNWWRNRSEVERLDIPAFEVANGGFRSSLGIFKVEEGKSVTQIVGTVQGPDGVAADIPLGDAEPDFQMSWFNEVTFFKNFNFFMLWHWKNGGDNIQLTSLLSDFAGTSYDYDDDDDGDGVINGVQRINGFIGTPDASQFIEDASYLKLREVALYYTLPKAAIQKAFNNVISQIKLGVSANNALIISDYRTYDPEVSNFGSNGVPSGVEVAPFPSSRRMFFHLNIGF